MVSGRYITIVNGLSMIDGRSITLIYGISIGFISQLKTWGPHPVVFNRFQHVKMELYGAQNHYRLLIWKPQNWMISGKDVPERTNYF